MSATIVLADDHGIVRDGLRLLLEAHSRFKVVGEADNGRDAIRMIVNTLPDIAIFDIGMPEQNGIEVTREICALNVPTRVLILSMHSNRRFISQALHAGARGFLLKEAAGSELVAAVDAILADHRYLSQQVADIFIEDYVGNTEGDEDDWLLSRLSRREREVVQLVVEGHSSAQIAGTLNLSPSTVDTYRSRIMRKLEIDTLPELVKFAIQEGLISLN